MHVFGRMARGGAELRTLEVVQRADPGLLNFRFCVLSGQFGELDEVVVKLGCAVDRCRLGILFPVRFWRLLRRTKVDTVHSHVHLASGLIVALAAAAGVPSRIVHFRSTRDDGTQSVGRRCRDWVLRLLINRFATRILGVSRAALRYGWRADWEQDSRCAVRYNGIDEPDGLDPDRSVREILGLPEPRELVVHVGSFRAVKNHVRLLEVFAELARLRPDIQLVLIGRRDELLLRKLQDRARHAGILDSIHVIGERNDVSRWLRSAHMMIFPSHAEGLPGAVLEALAHGVPVLASPLPVFDELVEYFPHLGIANADWNDQQWAAMAQQIVTSAPPGSRQRHEYAEVFKRSPFRIEIAAAELIDDWMTPQPQGG